MDFLKELQDTQSRLDKIEEARTVYLNRREEYIVMARNNNVPVSVIAEATHLSQVRVYQILQGR